MQEIGILINILDVFPSNTSRGGLGSRGTPDFGVIEVHNCEAIKLPTTRLDGEVHGYSIEFARRWDVVSWLFC